MLRLFCRRLGVEFVPAMLAWPPGPRPSDGTWAPHWYASVEQSRGFEAWRPRAGELSGELEALHRRCLPLYQRLWGERLCAAAG